MCACLNSSKEGTATLPGLEPNAEETTEEPLIEQQEDNAGESLANILEAFSAGTEAKGVSAVRSRSVWLGLCRQLLRRKASPSTKQWEKMKSDYAKKARRPMPKNETLYEIIASYLGLDKLDVVRFFLDRSKEIVPKM